MEFANYETAKKLNEVGFPHPDPALWQVWYAHRNIGSPSFIIQLVAPGVECWEDQFGGWFNKRTCDDATSVVYAPTATEILAALEGLKVKRIDWCLSPAITADGIEWACFQREIFTGKTGLVFNGKTAVEAAANAYIHQKTKRNAGN